MPLAGVSTPGGGHPGLTEDAMRRRSGMGALPAERQTATFPVRRDREGLDQERAERWRRKSPAHARWTVAVAVWSEDFPLTRENQPVEEQDLMLGRVHRQLLDVRFDDGERAL